MELEPAPATAAGQEEATLLERGEGGGSQEKPLAAPLAEADVSSWLADTADHCNGWIFLLFVLGVVFFSGLMVLAQRPAAAASGSMSGVSCLGLGCQPPTWGNHGQSVTVASAAIATDQGTCSDIGASVLAANGSAVDAAVAAALCLGVVHPHSSGLGGGCFILVYDAATGKAEAIDAREAAPSAATADMFVGNPQGALLGGNASAVPGELAGLYLAWQTYGKLPWSRLVLPAASLADGFVVDGQLAGAIVATRAAVAANPALAAVLMPGGQPLAAGQTCANPALAATLRAVAADGPAAFYGAGPAAAMAEDVRAAGGILTADDVLNYRAASAPALASSAWGMTFLTAPPPSSGGAAVALITDFLSGYAQPLASAGGLGAHRTVEALKHAFAARLAMAPDAGDPGQGALLGNMTDPGWAAALRAATSDVLTAPPQSYGNPFNPLNAANPTAGQGGLPPDAGTTHVSVVDAGRSAVALTSTVNTLFGSCVMTRSGVVMNNEMDDFSTPGQPNGYGLHPSLANLVAPFRRPLSSMSPTVVLNADGTLRAVAGASGGPRIISGTAQALINLVARGLGPDAAVQAPRWHHQLLPDEARYENASDAYGSAVVVAAGEVAALAARNHTVVPTATSAVVQLVAVDPDSGLLTAVSDLRKGGRPAGF